MKQSFYDLTYSELKLIINQNNLNDSAASVLFNWHYKKKETAQCLNKIAKSLLAFFEDNFDFSLPEIDTVPESKNDRTVKFLFKLKDNNKVETVPIPFHNKYSICLSSQVVCAMNYSFCFARTQGLKRNFTSSEIVRQFLQAWRWLAANR